MTPSTSALVARVARSRRARARATWRTLVLALAALLWAGCSGEVYGGADPDEVERAYDIGPACRARSTRSYDLRVTEVALYQVLKIPLYQDGAWLARRALPIIADKQALVRVFVQPEPGWEPRPLRAVLRLRHGDHTARLTDARTITAPSRDAELASTFNIEVSADLLTPDARIGVALEEADCALSSAAEAREAAAVQTPLAAEPRGTLRVVLVPMRVGGRVPKVTAATVTHITEALRAFFPVPEVEVLAAEVAPGDDSVPANDKDAWQAMLGRVGDLRARRTPEDDVYFVGLFQPAATYSAYCAKGCISGLAHPASAHDVKRRYAVAAFFGDEQGGETVAHELAHAHGLTHAPCAPAGARIEGADEAYPHRDGTTGAWGWDVRSKTLVPPDIHDLMSYCPPYGISAYHYAKLADRTRLVDRSPRALLASEE